MKLVRPGSAAPTPLDLGTGAMRRLRLGRMAGLLLAAGWLLTLALAPTPDASGFALALAGVGIGVVLARRPWDRQPERSLRMLVAVGTLHAAAGMVALDPAATASIPLFLAVAVLVGLLGPNRTSVLAAAAALAGVAVAVAALAPYRSPGAVGHALVLAPALMLAASAAAGAVALRAARAGRAHLLRGVGD